MTSGVTAGVNISYDEAFDTRVSADLKVRFGGASTTAQRKEVQQQPVINALTSSPSHRDVRVHDPLPAVEPGCTLTEEGTSCPAADCSSTESCEGGGGSVGE